MPTSRLEIPRLRVLARQAIPHIFEATLAPLALFYLSLWLMGITGALVTALGWTYCALLRRIITNRRIPGLLVLGALGLTGRTAIAFATGSTFVYFLQPTLVTVAIAGAFLLSVPAGRPLAERLAADFFPLPADVLASSVVRRFFVRISLLWAFVNLANAALTVWLLLTQSVSVYVAARTGVSVVFTGAAIALSTFWFKRSMREHNLLAAQ